MTLHFKMGLGTALFLVLFFLKLAGHITWSWWWVLSPLWLPAAIFLAIAALIIIAAIICQIFDLIP